MAWEFPGDHPFDLQINGLGDLVNCRVVAIDAEHVTFDYDSQGAFGLVRRFRAQVRIEDVRVIFEHAITANQEQEVDASEDSKAAARRRS